MLSNNNEINENDILKAKNDKLKSLISVFNKYGGVLSKIAQIVSTDNENMNVFDDCKAYSQDETVNYLKNYYNTNNNYITNISFVDFEIFKAGSVGQVHKCVDVNNNKLILKVQYDGLYKQFEDDIYMLDKIASYLFNFINFYDSLIYIKQKLFEELDYKLEIKNHKMLYDLWSSCDDIKIPLIRDELCDDKIICMEFIDGESLREFLLNSTQNQKNMIGYKIVKFIFTNLFKHNIFYSDIHYGNFIIKDKKILYITDFGCVHLMDIELIQKLKKIYKCIKTNNKNEFINVIKDLEIIKKDITEDSENYMFEYFKLQYEPWINPDFHFNNKWLEKSVSKKPELMSEWNLPCNLVYLNKICYGLYHILTKLNVHYNFTNLFEELNE
jgi:predicted unusual protein kinase regulating ubiquinone biosynthesis (AarF/ABC1/UbiB family)